MVGTSPWVPGDSHTAMNPVPGTSATKVLKFTQARRLFVTVGIDDSYALVLVYVGPFLIGVK